MPYLGAHQPYVEKRFLYIGPRPLVHRPTRDGSEHCHFRIPKQASGAAHGAGDGRSRVDIGRCEAQGGAPRPPPQPTGPRGPLGPCPARLVPHRRPQHPRLDPRQRPRLAALMEAGGVRERPQHTLSGFRPIQRACWCSLTSNCPMAGPLGPCGMRNRPVATSRL
jgi:hypothetical protein